MRHVIVQYIDFTNGQHKFSIERILKASFVVSQIVAVHDQLQSVLALPSDIFAELFFLFSFTRIDLKVMPQRVKSTCPAALHMHMYL